MKSKTELNVHGTRLISLVFEETLRKEGFFCPNDKKFHWYRRNGEDLLDCISFETTDPKLPMYSLEIRYEVIPLFLKPHYLPSISAYEHIATIRPSTCYAFVDDEPGDSGLGMFSNEIQVMVPKKGMNGLYSLTNDVLPYFAKIKTVEECYLNDKETWLKSQKKDEKLIIKEWKLGENCADTTLIFIYKDLLDQAINLGDYKLCEIGKNWVVRMAKAYQKESALRPNSKIVAEANQHWQQLQSAIIDNAYEEYIEILQRKKAANIKWINRFMGKRAD